MTRARRIAGVVLVVAWSVIVAVISIGIMRSCTPKPDHPSIVVAPDGGNEARGIEARLDAAVEHHEAEVRVIERTIVERRIVHERERDAEETAVRSRGRDAIAAWLSEFGRTVGIDAFDGGVEGGMP